MKAGFMAGFDRLYPTKLSPEPRPVLRFFNRVFGKHPGSPGYSDVQTDQQSCLALRAKHEESGDE